MFMCYVIVMICFYVWCHKKTQNTPGNQGDSAHLCYPDKDTGGRSTLVLNSSVRIEKRISMKSFKDLNNV